jgi:hypothetical protein
MEFHTIGSCSRRRARRCVQGALAGAALGAALIALPAHAAVLPVSGAESLSQAITDADTIDAGMQDTIIIDPGNYSIEHLLDLDELFIFTVPSRAFQSQNSSASDLNELLIFTSGGFSSPYSVTNSNGVIFDASNVGTVTLGTMTFAGIASIANGTYTAPRLVSEIASAPLIANDGGKIYWDSPDGADGGDGDTSGDGSGDGAKGNDGVSTGLVDDVIVNDSSSFTLNSGAGGAGGEGGYGGNLSTTDANGGIGGAGGDSSIIGNVTAADSNFTLNAGNGGYGGDGRYGGDDYSYTGDANGGAGGTGGNSSITGGVTATDSSFTLNAGAGGYGGDGGTGGEQPFSRGDANGGDGGSGGNSSITGDVTATDSNFTLNAGVGGAGGYGLYGGSGPGSTGNANGGDGGAGGSNGIIGNVTATDSSFTLNGGTGGAGGYGFVGSNGTGNANGGAGGAGGDSYIQGDVTANGQSTFTLTGGNGGGGGDGGFSDNENGTANGGAGGSGGDAYIDGNVTANDSSRISLYGGGNGSAGNTVSAYATGGAGGAAGEAYITGNAAVNDHAEIDLYNGSAIEGDLTVTHGGWFGMENDDDSPNVVNGNATFTDSANIWNYGLNTLNVDGGDMATTFDSSSGFAPYLNIYPDNPNYDSGNPITTDVLTVNNLTLDNSKLEPYWDYANDIPIGQTYDVLHYNGTLSGAFDPTVVSPLTFDVTYSSGYDGDVLLSVTGVDFTHMGGGDNQHSLESYLNHFYTTGGGEGQQRGGGDVITFDPDEKLPFDLTGLASDLTYDGPSALDYLIQDQYSAHNTQTYWNQQAFVSSIADNLRNDSNMPGGASPFALNQTGGTLMQLVSLRQAMTPAGGLGISENPGGASNGVWAAYTGSHQHTDADNGVGSNEWSSSSDGYTVGYTGGGEGFRWGVAAGHQKSTFTMADSNNEVDGWNAGLYASWKRKSTYLNGILGYGDYDNSVYTEDETDFKTHGLSAYLELGKRLHEKNQGGLSPYASLLWTRVKNGSASDEDSGFNLESGSDNVYTTALGMRYNHRMLDASGALKGGWQAGLAWLHQFGDTNFPVNGNYSATDPYDFQIESTGLSGDAAQVQLGAYGRIHGNLIGFADYVGTFGSKQDINGVSAGVGYQF